MNRSLRFQLVFFIIIRIVYNTGLRMVYPYLPVFGRSLGVDLAALSQAMALRSIAGAFGPFLAWIGDARGRKTGMLFGIALFAANSTLVFIFPAFPVFVASLVLNLLGYLAFNSSMQAYLSDRVPFSQRGRALALPELGWSLSFILGVPLVGLLIARYGWLAPFPVLAGLGLLAFVALARFIPGGAAQPPRQGGIWPTLRLILTCTPALAAMLMGAAIAMSNELVAFIIGVWLEDTFSVKIALLGTAAAVIGFAELSGELSAAGLVDRIGKGRAVAGGLLLNCAAALALPFLGTNLTGAVLGLFLLFVTFEFTVICSMPLISEILPQARATMIAVVVAALALGRAAGDILSPWLYTQRFSPLKINGMLAIGMAAVLLNLGGLVALRVLTQTLPATSATISTSLE